MSYLDNLFSLSGQAILITGASSGIGEHWAWTCCKAGCEKLALCARRTERLEKLATELRKYYPHLKVCVVTMDVSLDAKEITAALDKAEKALDGTTFNVIVNNAGVGPDSSFLQASQNSFDDTMKINVRGAFILSQETAKRMIAKNIKGSIINIASIYGLRVGYNNSVYAISKAAMVQMTKAMSIELLSKGIRVNCIAPG